MGELAHSNFSFECITELCANSPKYYAPSSNDHGQELIEIRENVKALVERVAALQKVSEESDGAAVIYHEAKEFAETVGRGDKGGHEVQGGAGGSRYWWNTTGRSGDCDGCGGGCGHGGGGGGGRGSSGGACGGTRSKQSDGSRHMERRGKGGREVCVCVCTRTCVCVCVRAQVQCL